MKLAALYGLIAGLLGGLFVGLILGLKEVLEKELRQGLIDGLFVVLILGLGGGLFSVGVFSVRHYALRLFLWLRRAAPFNYVAFLSQAKDLLFLRQVGGGYIFTHRLLREYFASLTQSEVALKAKAAGK